MSRAIVAGSPSAARVPAEPGLWAFLLGDMCVFVVIFASFLHDRAADPETFRASSALLDRNLGAMNTLLLLTSSWFVALGVRAAHERRHDLTLRLFPLAIACGVGFAVVKIVEYRAKIAGGVTLVTDDFFMYYFVATGIHFLHLTIGLVVLGLVVAHLLDPGPEGPSLTWIEGAGCYWHMVDLLWIVLFPLLYLVP